MIIDGHREDIGWMKIVNRMVSVVGVQDVSTPDSPCESRSLGKPRSRRCSWPAQCTCSSSSSTRRRYWPTLESALRLKINLFMTSTLMKDHDDGDDEG